MTKVNNPLVATRRTLRRELRARRDALPSWRRQLLARRITSQVARLPQLRYGAKISLYANFASEVPTSALRTLALRRGCHLYLPRISNFAARTMVFRRDFGRPLPRNRFGIGEPLGTALIAVTQFDLMLIPLVGFDDVGNRLGNGAGYYDRLLAALPRQPRLMPRPLLVGIAFECQRLEHIESAPHDVPLDAVISEHGLRYFQRR